MPPSMVLMPFANECSPSELYPVFHWNATSTSIEESSVSSDWIR